MERADRDRGEAAKADRDEAAKEAAKKEEAAERPDELTDLERELLDFEKQWWRSPGPKEQAIRDRFGLSPTRYYQLINELLGRPAALAYDPALVKRLLRLRTSRGRRTT
jgi:hypothetical protein